MLTVIQQLRPAHERLSNLFTPDTLRRWHRDFVKAKWHFSHRVVSRPRISLETQVLVWRMTRENDTWGYKRIQGELMKTGVQISTTSIRRILAVKSRPVRTGRPGASSCAPNDLGTPGEVDRTVGHPADQHAPALQLDEEEHVQGLQPDRLDGKHVTGDDRGGLPRGSPRRSDDLDAFGLEDVDERRSEALVAVVHEKADRFHSILSSLGKGASAERWIRTVRAECLDRVMVLGVRQLERMPSTYVKHYNEERPHRGLGLRPPGGSPPLRALSAEPSEIKRRDLLGGLIHEYYRKAA